VARKRQSPRDPEEVLRERLKRYRDHRGWSQQELARRVTEAGVTMHQTTVAKIEGQGEQKPRKVTVGELLALAVALDVPPAVLLLPLEEQVDVAVTPSTHAPVWGLYDWIAGDSPLESTDRPAWRRGVEPLAAYRRVKDAEAKAADAKVRGLRLRDLGRNEAADRFDESYMGWLEELSAELAIMQELGLPTEGIVAAPILDDLERYGVGVTHVRSSARRRSEEV
jgi:transcriptional regulator with XRE-family HTH domain